MRRLRLPSSFSVILPASIGGLIVTTITALLSPSPSAFAGVLFTSVMVFGCILGRHEGQREHDERVATELDIMGRPDELRTISTMSYYARVYRERH
jgi:hypothetical protein